MTKIIRVHYQHQCDPDVKNTYVDFELLSNQEKVTHVELMNVIPEHKQSLQIFRTYEDSGN